MSTRSLGLEDVFSDVITESRIVLSERLVDVIRDVTDLDSLLGKYTDLGFHKVVVEYRIDGRDVVVKIYRYRGRLLAIIHQSGGELKTGDEALGIVEEYASKGYRGLARIFDVNDELLKDLIGEDKFKEITRMEKAEVVKERIKEVEKPTVIEETTKPQPTGMVEAGKAVEEGVGKPAVVKPRVDYRREVKRVIDELGLEEIFIDVREEEDNTKIIVELNPLPTWVKLRSIAYAVMAAYLKHKDPEEYPPVKAEIVMGEDRDSILLIDKRELLIARIIGEALHTLSRNGIPVVDSTYKIEKNNKLVVSLKVKKPVYPGVTIEDTLREAYERVKELWRGELELRAKKGRFGEVKIPKK